MNVHVQKIFIYPVYPRDSTMIADKRFVNIGNGSMGGSHWTCFIIKDKKSYYFDSYGGEPNKFLLNYLCKPIKYQNKKKFKIQSLKYAANISYTFAI